MVVTQVVIWWSHDFAIIQCVCRLIKKKQVGQPFKIIRPAATCGRGGWI